MVSNDPCGVIQVSHKGLMAQRLRTTDLTYCRTEVNRLLNSSGPKSHTGLYSGVENSTKMTTYSHQVSQVRKPKVSSPWEFNVLSQAKASQLTSKRKPGHLFHAMDGPPRSSHTYRLYDSEGIPTWYEPDKKRLSPLLAYVQRETCAVCVTCVPG